MRAAFRACCCMMMITAGAAASTPMEHYTFTPENCAKGFFPNDISNNDSTNTTDGLVVLNNNTIQCAPSMGVSGTTLKSSLWNDRDAIADGIAFELWWKPPPVKMDVTLLSIRQQRNVYQKATAAASAPLTPCDRDGFDFELVWRENTFLATFRTSSVFLEPCQQIYYSQGGTLEIMSNKMTHIMVVLRDGFQAIYVNGQQSHVVFSEPFANNLSHWSNSRNELYLLPNDDDNDDDNDDMSSSRPNTALFYQFAMYSGNNNMTLATEIQKLLLEGLPYSPPFAFDQDVIVNEDAEIVAGSHHVEWYQQANKDHDATVLKAPLIGDINEEVKELIMESVVDSGTGNNNSIELPDFVTQDPPPVYVYLTDLPHLGRLYFNGAAHQDDDNNNATVPIIIPIGTAPVNKLIYLPPHNAHSIKDDNDDDGAFTSFRYCISTTPIFDAAQCMSSAMVRIHVLPVNDPPVALPVQAITTVTEGAASSKIPLLGMDVDVNDSIQMVRITRLPQYGSLILAVPTFRKDRIKHGTPLSNLNFTVSGDDAVYVKYVWREEANVGIVVQGTNVKDSFWFRVRDKHGLWSAEEKVEVQVLSAVSADVQPIVTVDEDSLSNLQWQGNDRSGFNRRLGFFVEKLPSANVGTLSVPSTGELLQVGSTIKATDENGRVQIVFRSTSDFCHTAEAQMENDAELRFRVVAFNISDVTSSVVSVSDSASQRITVACVLDVISMKVPSTAALSVLETSLERTATDPCHSLSFDAATTNAFECTAAAVINGIQVISSDRKSDRAKVTVSTRSGYLSFNKLYWNRTEPVVGRPSVASGVVSFYAFPEDLTNIFSNLHFQSYVPGYDRIEIELQYGNCADEIDAHETGSFKTPTCQVVRRSIPVIVLRDDDKYQSETRLVVGFPWHILFCLLVYPILYFAVVYLESSCSGDDDDNETVIEGSPLEPVERFIQHEDENGMFYYEDTWDGSTRWDLPPGEDFVPYEEIGT